MSRVGKESQDVTARHRERHRPEDTGERAAKPGCRRTCRSVTADWELSNEPFERVLVKPKRGGVSVQLVALVWVPAPERVTRVRPAVRGRGGAR